MVKILVLIFSLIVLGACSEVQFEKSPVSTNAIKTLQPALAVRATGCIMCHADVRSNIVTDFGYGDSYYFGGSVSGLAPESGSVYGNHSENWQSAKIAGTVYVPDASTNGKVAQGTLQTYLQNAFANSPETVTQSAKVETKRKVFIGAPSADRIRQLAGGFPAGTVWRYMGQGSLSGIRPAGSYVTNTSPTTEIVCEGDLVVDSVLYLNQPRIRTTNGCRIYVSKSVFIDGPITYVGGSPNANLQISSARSINLGLGENNCGATYSHGSGSPVRNRLTEMWTIEGYFTREGGSVTSKLNSIYSDYQTIGSPPDAACQAAGRGVEFNALILNAPQVNSRYNGNFKGAIIAEIAIMSLGAFKYEFDDLFLHVPVLPLLKPSEFLDVE